MKKFKKIILRIFLVFLTLIPIAAVAHFIIFRQESRCILIDYSSFKKQGRLYFNANTSSAKMDTLKTLITQGTDRVADFWGKKNGRTKIIYYHNDEDFK